MKARRGAEWRPALNRPPLRVCQSGYPSSLAMLTRPIMGDPQLGGGLPVCGTYVRRHVEPDGLASCIGSRDALP
jgi:hypothetical protein